MSEQTTLRDVLDSSFEAAEAENAASDHDGSYVEPNIEPLQDENKLNSSENTENRDEKGRFKAKSDDSGQKSIKKHKNTANVDDVADVAEQKVTLDTAEKKPLVKPNTWKKEYLPLWERMAAGESLSPEEAIRLAEYTNQREDEYKGGVSLYRQQAMEAKALQDAMAPFISDLQRHNIEPSQWISNLGNAHKMLVQGSPEQKLQMFSKLAQDYGVPIHAIGSMMQGEVDPYAPHMMQLHDQIKDIAAWRDQLEQKQIMQEISMFADTEKYPHFEAVRQEMAKLLESGVSSSLEDAYKKAVRLNDELFTQSQEADRKLKEDNHIERKREAVKLAKSRNVVPKSSSSALASDIKNKDLRSMLEEQFSGAVNGRI